MFHEYTSILRLFNQFLEKAIIWVTNWLGAKKTSIIYYVVYHFT